MEGKISSSYTEFYKVYGIASLIIFIILFFVPFFVSFFEHFDFPLNLLIAAIVTINLCDAFDFWRMKEVEAVDAGLLITRRFFFTQKTVFVPYDKVESVKNKHWWLGKTGRISVRFKENTEFGKEISFLSSGYTRTAKAEILLELNRTIVRHQNAERLNPAFQA